LINDVRASEAHSETEDRYLLFEEADACGSARRLHLLVLQKGHRRGDLVFSQWLRGGYERGARVLAAARRRKGGYERAFMVVVRSDPVVMVVVAVVVVVVVVKWWWWWCDWDGCWLTLALHASLHPHSTTHAAHATSIAH
jgi:hypothetical protein